MDVEKLKYIGLTMLPLVGIPIFTRRYERFILLIPYLLFNLMSDYRYQHDIMFQYNFGSIACLIYLVLVNIADMKKYVAVHICRQFFLGNVSPPDVEAVIRRNVSPIRPGRSSPRKMTVKHTVNIKMCVPVNAAKKCEPRQNPKTRIILAKNELKLKNIPQNS